MLDFYTIGSKGIKRGVQEIFPSFIVTSHPKDLMVRGRDFYAVWNEETGMWSTDEGDVISFVDTDIDNEKLKRQDGTSDKINAKYMRDSNSGMIDLWHKYVQKQMRDTFKILDNKITFANTKTTKRDYVSKRLEYDLKEGPFEAWDEIISTLYDPEEREKIEWSIGAIISGDAKEIQKFIVFYGSAGSGKSTIMNVIQKLFEGYYNIFDAKELTSANNSFALESFKGNPLVSIQHDGDLSRIEDNTKLNSIVSHEKIEINEKFKSKYTIKLNSFLYMGTNKPVKITEAKSGIIRRLIDVRPSGRKLPFRKYKDLMSQVDFELGAIAWHCLEVYKELGMDYYDDYIPKDMISSTNDFYDFIEAHYDRFAKDDGITLKACWELYKDYCEYANVAFPFSMRQLRVELENYFKDKKDNALIDGVHVRNYYSGFDKSKFPGHGEEKSSGKKRGIDESEEDGPYGIRKDSDGSWIIFKDASSFENGSVFDRGYESATAQYAKEDGSPRDYWSKVKTKLMDLNTSELHYILLPENHIVIDFDLKNEDGEKDLKFNLEAASKFPKTYAELSKSGSGIHLHYIYDGDPSKLSHIYDDHIEIKTFGGKSALRRKLTKCNDLEIAHINSGLPLKGVKNTVVDMNVVNLEKSLRTTIKKCLAKEVHDSTAPNVDFIKKILDDAYASGKPYDVTDLRQAVLVFANNSTHQAAKCVKQVGLMHFKSEEPSVGVGFEDSDEIIFFDWEVFPNFCCMCWKVHGHPGTFKLINPKPVELEQFVGKKLVGFNNRRYDNHIFYARWARGYSNEQLYKLSRALVEEKDKKVTFSEAYNLSYTDVWDFASNKQGLKKWEIELGISHVENAHPWNQPLEEKYWDEVSDYCCNDVEATEIVFDKLKEDWKARQILADLTEEFGGCVNDTTNTLTKKLVFGNEKNPILVYTDLATGEQTEGR